MKTTLISLIVLLAAISLDLASAQELSDLAKLTPGKTAAQNALWGENPKDKLFSTTRRVVVADISGPAEITMIHFALPERSISKPKEYTLGRDVLIRIYWDGNDKPSVECPFVDFFCDPAGLRDRVDTALVNKKRGFNAYFPMPFRKSARIELVYDGPVQPGGELWAMMPCYSYVMYRALDKFPENSGYLHANWRQELLPLGKRDYVALETTGSGKFVGWNVTVRLPGRGGYPVDENEKFYIDGENEASIEFQGLEDSFGFSWGFPEKENFFPMTGYFPFKEGAAAYRFFTTDAIRFEKSLKVAIGFGKNEDPSFRRQFSPDPNALEFSSVCYWYQPEPHAAMPPMPPAKDRVPTAMNPAAQEKLPTAAELRARGVKVQMRCGRPEKEITFAEAGYGAKALNGFTFAGFPYPIYYCRADNKDLQIELTVPKGSAGKVRVFVIDPDHFQGGRKQDVIIDAHSVGVVQDFDEGKWLEREVGSEHTMEGKVLIEAKNLNPRPESNAVISIVEWVGA